eukprot:6570700-Pyramimonas_sp.AAC.1
MNWDGGLDGSGRDGRPPLGERWVDVWEQCRPGDPGHTLDTKANPMLTYSLRKRLDRVFCCLGHFELVNVEMVGTEPIEGVTYDKMVRGKPKSLPVLPSDHFGLVVTLKPRVTA